MTRIDMIPLITLLITLPLATVQDIRFQKIPNWLTFTTMAVAIVYHTIAAGKEGLIFSCEGIVVGIALLMVPYLQGGMGAGDAKLMGGIGGLLGPKGVFIAFLVVAIIGGIYAFILLAYHGNLGKTLRRYGMMAKLFVSTGKFVYIQPAEKEKKPRLRYAIPIALGTLFSVFAMDELSALMTFI